LILKSFGGQCPSFWLGPEPNKNGVWLWPESLLGNNQGSSVYTLLKLSRNAFTTSIGMARMTSKSRRNSSQFASVVTGAAGFLGSHLTDLLLARGHKVIGIDNFVTGTVDNISHLGGNSNFKFIQQDVTEFIFLEGAVDFVWHFASPASPIDYLELPIQTLKVGSLGTHKALGLAKNKKARFLLASTSEIYGDPLVHPQSEDYWGNVNPIGPRGCYDEAKRFAEALTIAYHKEHGVETRIVRIFNTYGPRMRLNDGRVVPAFISQALKNKPLTVFGRGKQTRSFCYVSDLIDGIHRLMMSSFDQPVNIGNPLEMTVLAFAKAIIAATRSRSTIAFKPLPQDDPKQRQPNISRARKLLGWQPKVPLEKGLQQTIEYFRSRV
jgi:dTDP-glucose 4,6-dehydratase